MSHPSIYSYTFIIPQNVIDEYGHVNNVAYVGWMQDAAIRHGEAMGYKPPEHAGWFAREHHIKYFSPAFLGDEIEARTWITEWKRVRLHRNYEFTRTSDGKVIARGETDWIYVDVKSGRPMSIPKDIKVLFPVVREQPGSD
ncbi:MAG: thioesterase family protein [Lysobacterales bacterium]|jgi:acyl-CoA thioester hydrolase